MEMKVEKYNNRYLCPFLLVLAGIVALFPVSCNYIMSGGIVTEWIARVEEIAVEGVCLFPKTEVFVRTGIWENAMDSNLWFWFSGILYRWSGNMVLVYRVYMLAVQIGTVFFSLLFFQSFFSDRASRDGNSLSVCCGVLLYMTCPYRIYLCYDQEDLSMAVVWMLVPLYAWAVTGIMRRDRFWRNLSVAAFALMGIGYADTVSFLVFCGITLIVALLYRDFLPMAVLAAGGILFLPGLYRLAQYLFTDNLPEFAILFQSIMGDGYRLGQIFDLYVYRDGHPGMGLGMLVCLLMGLWMSFLDGRENADRRVNIFVVIGVFLLTLSTRYFPWDLVQRVGSWSLRLVSLIDTPSVFGGFAFGILCVPAAAAMKRIRRQENPVVACAVPVMILLACLGVCIYQCNMLIYARLPLDLP